MKYYSISITVFFILLTYSCHNTSTGTDAKRQIDTTSHAMSWQVFEMGNYSSIIKDISVIAQDDIWAVGEIYTDDTYTYDSLGNWIDPYNAAHWDGEKWELKRIYYIQDGSKYWRDITAIFAFSKNDIWFGNFTHWNGVRYESIPLNIPFPSQINKIWGTSSSDLYVVGNGGLIAHYNGTNWTKIESGTTIKLIDIWGSPDGKSVWICGFDEVKGSVLLKNSTNGFETVVTYNASNPHGHNQISYAFQSVWAYEPDTVYVASVGRVYRTPLDYSSYAPEMIWYDYKNQSGYPNEIKVIRGVTPKDLFIAGYQNEILHYNGNSWHTYEELLTDSGYWYALSINKTIIAAGGRSSQPKALIAIGTR